MRMIVRIAVWMLLAGCFPAALRAGGDGAEFFVAVDGNDAWSGARADAAQDRSDGPFATVDAARRAVRAWKASHPAAAGPITVHLRGGTHFLPEPIKFSTEDGGGKDAPVIYTAYRDEKPVLSGGARITGWKVGADGRWRAALPEVKAGKWSFSQLFVNGQRRQRPRLPASGYFTVAQRKPPDPSPGGKGVGDNRFGFTAGDISPDWKSRGDIEVITFHPWFTSMLRIASVDAKEKVVTFTGRTRGTDAWAQLKPGMRYLVENVREALDAPGEWHLDRAGGELTYIPLPGESPDKTEVIAPRLVQLVRVSSAPAPAAPPRAPWVEHLRFEGISFAHTNWVTPPEGSSIAQAAVTVPAAVSLAGARECSLTQCDFSHLGGYAVEFGAACQDGRIESCRMSDLGAGGVKVGTTHLPTDEAAATSRILVRDNLIAHAGRIHPAAVGVWIGQADHITVEHNDIHDLYYTGISVGWTWGYGRSAAHHNTISYNHIHDIGQGVLGDMAFIYTLGISPGTTIHHNRFHGVRRHGYGGWGIYYDEGSSGIVSKNNLVYDTQDGGFHQHYGENNVMVNNLLADSLSVQFGPSRINGGKAPFQPGPPFTFERNVVVQWEAPSVIRTEWLQNALTAGHLDLFKVDHNVYWNGDQPVRFAGLTFEQWQAKGLDVHSVVADPRLGDWLSGRVEVAPDSPAAKVGFQPFDVTGAGRLNPDPPDLDSSRWPAAFPTAPAARAVKAGGKRDR